MKRFLAAAACGLAVLCGTAAGDEKMPLELKIVVKKDRYPWPYGQGPKEFEANLKELLKKKGDVRLPEPPAVDLVLQVTNMGTEKTTVYVGGDPNRLTLELKGPGVVTATPMLAFTTDFRLPQAVELAAGKSHEIQIKTLKDGFRQSSRYIYATAPGEYTISATYLLSNAEGGKGPELKSKEAKFKIEEPTK